MSKATYPTIQISLNQDVNFMNSRLKETIKSAYRRLIDTFPNQESVKAMFKVVFIEEFGG